MLKKRTLNIVSLLALLFTVTYSMNGCSPDFAADESLYSLKPYRSSTVAELKSSCDSQIEDIEPTALRRLSTQEYNATIHAIFQCEYNCYYSASPYLDPALDTLPSDAKRDSISTYVRFSNLDQQMSDERVAAYHSVALAAANYIETLPPAQDGGFGRVFDSCFVSGVTPDVTCQDKMIRGFGLKAFRRPLSDSQFNAIKTAMAAGTGFKQQLGFAVYFILMSPDFIYHLESDGTQIGTVLTLDSYGVASKISYLLMGRNPDAELLTRASQNKLQTKAEIDAALEYIKATYPALLKDQFWKFTSEWLDVSTTAFTNNTKSNAQSAPEFSVSSQGAAVRSDMNQEIRSMFEYYIFDHPQTYFDLLTNQKSFARGSVLPALYGVAAWDGVSAPPNHVAGQRKGFLTTAAILTPGATITHPFTTGGLVHKHILCREFGDTPEPKNFPGLDQTQEGALTSTRTKYEQLVPRASACMSCHSSIESLGMTFQSYDTFGRFRNGIEKVHASDGSFVGTTPVNTRTTPLVGTGLVDVVDAVDLIGRIANTTEPQACLAKQFLRYSYSRKDGPRDSCALYRFASNLQTATTWDAVKSFIDDDWFKKRRLD